MNMGMSYTLGNTFTLLLLLIVKLLTIVLGIVLVLGVIRWMQDNFLKNKTSNFTKGFNEDPILKAVVVITVAVIGLVLGFTLFHSLFSSGGGMNFNGRGVYFNPMISMTSIIIILIRILMFILVISLILAGVMYFKGEYEKGNLFSSSSKDENNQTIGIKDKK